MKNTESEISLYEVYPKTRKQPVIRKIYISKINAIKINITNYYKQEKIKILNDKIIMITLILKVIILIINSEDTAMTQMKRNSNILTCSLECSGVKGIVDAVAKEDV